jgi:hypothetical protein
MKIGIVTFWRSEDNYGQILQCYALQTFLKEMGHDVFLIKDAILQKETDSFIKKNIKRIKNWRNISFKRYYMAFYYRKLEIISIKTNKLHPRNFEIFKKKYISFTDKEYTIDMLRENPPKADVYICGSDQIWGSFSPFYYLDFGINTKRISYAASFGPMEKKKALLKQISLWIKQFDIVTVRENKGLELCKKLGRQDAICVIDPTLLLTRSHYMQIMEPYNVDKEYIFLYMLGNKTTVDIKGIYDFARKENLEVIYVASQGQKDKYDKTYPTIEQWIFLLSNAKYVITNSYHGAIFSIIMNKQFLLLPLSGFFKATNDRFHTLLTKYDLQDKLFHSDIMTIKKEIEYYRINLILEEDIEKMKKNMETWL